jgi:hypothetical protein
MSIEIKPEVSEWTSIQCLGLYIVYVYIIVLNVCRSRDIWFMGQVFSVKWVTWVMGQVA